jgi:hypothetical protein
VRERVVADRPYTVGRIEALYFLLCNTNFLMVQRETDAIWLGLAEEALEARTEEPCELL